MEGRIKGGGAKVESEGGVRMGNGTIEGVQELRVQGK
jgi:hypothetical protein